MNSIRSRLLSSFITIILLMGTVTATLLVMGSIAQREVNSHDRVLFAAYGLIARTDEILRTYNQYRNAPTPMNEDAYTATKLALQSDIRVIVEHVETGGARPAVTGSLNILDAFLASTERGMEAVRTHDLSGSGEAYGESARIKGFIGDSVEDLILEELKSSRDARASVDRLISFVMYFGIASVLFAVSAGLAYAFSFSKGITLPLTKLTQAASQIAQGSYDVHIEPGILQNNDETGSLARSFQAMSSSLRETVRGLREAQAAALKAQEETQSKNDLLEQLNRLFISREARIGELKEEITKLGGTVTPHPDDRA